MIHRPPYVGPGFTQARRLGQTESSLLSYGWIVHLLLLPTPPRGDAVAIGYRPESAYLKRTSTSLTKCAFRRTGGGSATAGPIPLHQQDRYIEPATVFHSLVDSSVAAVAADMAGAAYFLDTTNSWAITACRGCPQGSGTSHLV